MEPQNHSVLFYVGNELGNETHGYLFKKTDLFHRKLGKLEQESLFDKQIVWTAALKQSVGQLQSCASPPVLRSAEECNCGSFIHHCQQTRFLRDALEDLSASNSAPPYYTCVLQRESWTWEGENMCN